ncbi:MAG TPA: UDP-glucose 4-epimerase GalE [Streptosporangiaceae bacterium]|nr:UDP-glucose 4-epimerase GalE [Streptosporangiaceae bacterium]
MRLLVTGGAGYIGGVVATLLTGAGHEVTVIDDLSTGYADAVPAEAAFVKGTVRDHAQAVLASGGVAGAGIDAVFHFAAKSLVAESVAKPSLYWEHNLGGTLALLEAMRVTGTARIVFSSTAAVYGEPERVPIDETAPTRPGNPYGASKVAVDTALAEHARMHGIGAVSLRYFNVAGAHAGRGGRWLGERHHPETHLIPNILRAAAGDAGPGAEVSIFGDDYPTPDGTCVRDYIHVTDLANAHLLALDACVPGQHRVYNLGSGSGYSNLEVLQACREVTGREIPARTGPRRAGDPAVLIASSALFHAERGWRPRAGLQAMVADAWEFTRGQPR